MLRISDAQSCDGLTSTQEHAAAGIDSDQPPVVETTPKSQKEFEDLGPNHAFTVLPWITEEIRFHSVLDLGCGDGSAVKALQEAGYEAHGIDLDPTGSAIPHVEAADVFQWDFEEGYFDLVLCCNMAQYIPNSRISELLSKMDRLSNSYMMMTMPSMESHSEGARPASFWTQRIEDFGWHIRLLREDPDTGHMVLLCEKRNSLAAQILPLLNEQGGDAGPIDEASAAKAPSPTTAHQPAIDLIDEALQAFERNDPGGAFQSISSLADLLLGSGENLTAIHPIFAKIVGAMERQDNASLEFLLSEELRPALQR